MPQDDAVDNDDGGDYVHLLHPVQVLKNHLRLIHGSMILDHTRTRFLGGDLYAEQLIREYIRYVCWLWLSCLQDGVTAAAIALANGRSNVADLLQKLTAVRVSRLVFHCS